MFGALSVFGRHIKGMIRLRPEQVWTCNVTRHYRPLLSPYVHDASGSHNKLGTPWSNARRILLRHEAGMKVQTVAPYHVSHLQRYGVTVRGNVTSVYPYLQ
jgi:hypothetical protein